ncbi:MAG: WD40 repeat domain-containing protein [Gemmataceae bacterium]
MKNEEAAKKESAEKEVQRRRALEKSIRLTVSAGLKLQQEGEGVAALLHFAEAAALEDPHSPTAWLHDARLAACLDLYPRVDSTWAHRDAVTSVAFSPDGRHVLSSSVDGTVQVRRSKDGKLAFANPLTHAAAVNDACFSADGKRVLTASEDKTARLWNAETGEPESPPLKHPFPVLQVAFDPVHSGKMLAVVGNRNALATQRAIPRTVTMQRIVTGVGPNGIPQFQTIPVLGPPAGTARQEAIGRVEIWDDIASGKPSRSIPALGWVQHAAFSMDGLRVVIANASLEKVNAVALWSVNDAEKPPFIKLPHLVTHASINSDGSRIAAAMGHAEKGIGEARLFDGGTQQSIGSVMKHRGPVSMVQFSPDGKTIATASFDGTARLWDAMGEPISEPMRHRDRVVGILFSPDGKSLLTASSDGSARVWSATHGEPLTPFLQHGSPVTHAAFHPNSSIVAVGCAAGVVRLWNVEPKALERPAFKLQDLLPAPTAMTCLFNYGAHVRKISMLPGRVATSVRFDRSGDRLIVAAGQRFQETTPGNQTEALTATRRPISPRGI